MLKNRVKYFCLFLVAALLLASCYSCTAIQKSIYSIEYEELIVKYGDLNGIPHDLLAALIDAESNFEADAVSSVGAVGLMQLMPSTAKEVADKMGEEYDEKMLTDPETNICYGTYYLSYLYNNLGKNWETACAAYNAGIGRVSSWLCDERYSDDGITLKDIPIKETATYVNKIKKNREIYKKLYFDSEGDGQ